MGNSSRRRFTDKVNGGCGTLVIIAVFKTGLQQTEFEVFVRTKFLSLLDQFNTDAAAVVGGFTRGTDRVSVVSDFDEIRVFGTARAAGKKQG